ncbi:hypothetical protein MD535_10355 [Vibrio sp. ZSDZ65]|uniref:Uncharacterized protein n=1 Tax=Vibrio qingdaonensis TaxID=2829491 RepID=A0A9X3HX36_9VIBR|nr:hypothetical protein [Vibrio qingdaonensis]MCW8346402.1 hypothetical protein [Vibrio qingdaonensis]
MKLKLISTLIAASFLAGCSSNGSSNDGDTGPAPQDGIAEVTTYEGDIFNAALIQGDEGEHNAFVAVDNEGSGYIHLNGETYFVDNGDVTDKNGDAVGSVQGQDGNYIFHGNNGGEITLTNVDGRLVVSGYQPPRPDNELPITDPEFDGGVLPTYGDILEVGGAIIIQGDGDNSAIIRADGEGNAIIAINDYDNMYVVKDGELINDKGETVGHIQQDNGQYTVRLDDGTEVVFRNENGRLFAAVIARPSPDNDLPNVDPDFDGGTLPTYGDILEIGGAVIIQGDGDNNAIIRTDGEGNAIIAVNDYDNMYIVKDGALIDEQGNTIGHIQSDNGQYTVRLDNGTEVVFRNENGRLFAAVINQPTPESFDFKGERINSVSQETIDDVKNKLRNLSQEQRQQIKQAVKDRVNRS